MRIKIACAAGLFAVLTACTATTDSSQPTSTPAPPTSQSLSEEAPAGGACPVGDYEVTSISGKGGTQVNGIPITVSSAGALKLKLTEAGTWQLSGDGVTVTLQASGVAAEATVDGTAEGVYSKVGEDYAFRQDKAIGKVTLKKPIAGTSSLPMSDVGPALAPGGTAKLTCGDGTLTIASESVTLELKRVGGGGTSTPPSTSSGGGGASGGATLTINESAQTKTVDCAGRNVALNGSANTLTFTGGCGTISVNGSRNVITLEKVGQISVNGSANKITWASGDPKVSNNGTGNTINKG